MTEQTKAKRSGMVRVLTEILWRWGMSEMKSVYVVLGWRFSPIAMTHHTFGHSAECGGGV
jgi:hypothetical protein